MVGNSAISAFDPLFHPKIKSQNCLRHSFPL